jgi:hypothetical protein
MDTRQVATGWIAIDLPEVRDQDGTYSVVAWSTLPPLTGAVLDGTLRWLTHLDEEIAEEVREHQPDERQRAELTRNFERIAEEARAARLALPKAFLRLFHAGELQDRIPSSTACYFELSPALAKAPRALGGHLVRFLRDQQGGVFWYLWLRPDGADAVIASPALLDGTDEAASPATAEMFLCAARFEEFLYRFWLESSLWFALTNEHRQLTEAEEQYVEFYRATRRH